MANSEKISAAESPVAHERLTEVANSTQQSSVSAQPQLQAVTGSSTHAESLSSNLSSYIFIKGREGIGDPDIISKKAYAELSEFATNNDLLSLISIQTARDQFEKLYSIQKRITNSTLSLSAQQYDEFSQLFERIFFSIKSICCIKKKINKEDRSSIILKNIDLKKQYLLSIIASNINEAFSICCNDAEDRQNFLNEIINEVGRERELEVNTVATHNRCSETGKAPIIHENVNVDEIGDMPMKEETKAKLKEVFDYWTAKFSALHEEAELAIAKHDTIEKELEAAMERRMIEASARMR